MLTRHKNDLLRRLERVIDLGSCEIMGSELRRWYSRERITKIVWADILDLWSEIDNDDGNKLLIGVESDIYTLIFSDGLIAPKSSWWSDMNEWAK